MAELSIEQFRALAEAGKSHALLDIREPGEYNARHIPNSTSLPRRDIEFRLADLAPGRDIPIIVVGDGGERARLAAATMALNGYESVYLLRGGCPAWIEAGRPTATGTNVPSKRFGEEVHRKCEVPEIDPRELHLCMARGEPIRVLDARTPEEYGRFCIPGGINVPGGDLVLWAGDLKKEPGTRIVINCAGRTRGIIG
ncbi:MAG: sulfurtransferase, partial [Deltaproteobacteria bacterium]|nr:sulfurtransferase [Deltaproteobacteria bacterium]